MVNRNYLTKELIDSLEPPTNGEAWIADTVVRGFGFRIWTNSKGENRANYCIRVTDYSGKAVRKSISFSDLYHLERVNPESRYYEHNWDQVFPHTLGDLIPEAREWAKDEISRLKKVGSTRQELKNKLDQEDNEQSQIVSRHVQKYTLQHSSDLLISAKRSLDVNLQHCDRLDQIFSRFVPSTLAMRRTSQLSEQQFIEIFQNYKLSKSNAEVLRPHLRQCLEMSERCGVKCNTNSRRLADIIQSIIYDKSADSELKNWRIGQFKQALTWLLVQENYWQQALCLILYLESPLPKDRLLKIQYENCYAFVENSLNRMPELDLIKLSEKPKDTYVLDEFSYLAISRAINLNQKSNYVGEYLFPSNQWNDQESHITSLNTILNLFLKEFDLPQQKLSKLKKEWNQTRWRSYTANKKLLTFIEQKNQTK